MNKLLLLPVALACTGAIASSNTPITGTVESKCVIQTDTDGVYGNPTADNLSTYPADGGVKPVIRYDIVTANAYKALISYPTSFSSSPDFSKKYSAPETKLHPSISEKAKPRPPAAPVPSFVASGFISKLLASFNLSKIS